MTQRGFICILQGIVWNTRMAKSSQYEYRPGQRLKPVITGKLVVD